MHSYHEPKHENLKFIPHTTLFEPASNPIRKIRSQKQDKARNVSLVEEPDRSVRAVMRQ